MLANKWSGAIPDFLPIEQKEIRNMMNETERSIPFKCLHEAFFECAYRFPDKTALEWLSLDEKWETLSYEALKIKVLQTASMLKQEGVHTRDKVAIVLPKGENQIIAVLAILSIGATYVPIGIHQPLDRKKKIFEAGNISYALTDRDHINTLDGADTLRSFLIENSFRYVVMPETEIVKDIDSIAYIIFTSGTTGIPKGVMITHKAAYNTIYDVNDKFTINEHDCAIAVSELDFDLSVYDIFGMLGYGASLIVLNEMNKREPYIWKKILCEKRVTIWNSVPALFEMFLLAIGYDYEKVTLCQKYGLSEGRWHMCISGENTLKVLERARYDYQVNKDKTLRNICRASKLDCFGTTGITKFVCSIAGMVSNEVIEKSLLLTSSNPSRLTGSVAAATVLTILEMGMERGSFLLSKSKINLEVMKKLLNIGTEIRVSIRDNIGSDEIEGEI